MNASTGQFIRNQGKSAEFVTGSAVKENSLRARATLVAILLASASAWAGDHQICYQVPPLPGLNTIAARFACRTDGANQSGCDITSVEPDAQVVPFTTSHTPTSAEAEVTLRGPGSFVATIQFNDGIVRKCTVEVTTGYTFTSGQGSQLRTPIGFTTDASGLVMTGVWQATSNPAQQAFQEVVVPPDFVAVGGGAEGTESPDGTLVTSSIGTTSFSWLGGARSNTPPRNLPQISPVIAWGIGLKIEGVPLSTLRRIVYFTGGHSTGYQSRPTVTVDLLDRDIYPQTTATVGGLTQQTAISGGVQAEQGSSTIGQHVTTTQPLVSRRCYVNGTCEQLVRGWVAASKDHVNPSPWWVVAQMTTLPKVLTINGNTFHVETWVSQATSAQLAHPSATAVLPGDFALTGVGAFVDYQTSPNAAGNMVWRLKPRADFNGVDAASKDHWFSSPAAITAFAIGMKLVPGPVPPLWVKTR